MASKPMADAITAPDGRIWWIITNFTDSQSDGWFGAEWMLLSPDGKKESWGYSRGEGGRGFYSHSMAMKNAKAAAKRIWGKNHGQ